MVAVAAVLVRKKDRTWRCSKMCYARNTICASWSTGSCRKSAMITLRISSIYSSSWRNSRSKSGIKMSYAIVSSASSRRTKCSFSTSRFRSSPFNRNEWSLNIRILSFHCLSQVRQKSQGVTRALVMKRQRIWTWWYRNCITIDRVKRVTFWSCSQRSANIWTLRFLTIKKWSLIISSEWITVISLRRCFNSPYKMEIHWLSE